MEYVNSDTHAASDIWALMAILSEIWVSVHTQSKCQEKEA